MTIQSTKCQQKKLDDPAGVIENWLKNRNTIEFWGLWEQMNNPNFIPLELEEFRNETLPKNNTATKLKQSIDQKQINQK